MRSHHRPSGWRKHRLVCETSFNGWYGLPACSPEDPLPSPGTATAGANAWNWDGTGSGGTNPGGSEAAWGIGCPGIGPSGSGAAGAKTDGAAPSSDSNDSCGGTCGPGGRVASTNCQAGTSSARISWPCQPRR